MPAPTEPCAVARAHYGPGRRFKMTDFERHVASCTQCQQYQRSIARSASRRTRYSRDFPQGTGQPVHRYLLIAPDKLWRAFEQRCKREQQSVRSRLLQLIARDAGVK